MIVFKILLIILVAAPVIGISLYFYSQMLAFIGEKNKREKAEIERERMQKKARKKSAADRKKEVKKEKKEQRSGKKKKSEGKRSEEQE